MLTVRGLCWMRQLSIKKSLILLLVCFIGSGYPVQAENVKKKLAMLPVRGPALPSPKIQKPPVPASAPAIKATRRASYPNTHMQKGFFFKQQGNLNKALLEFILAVQENPRQVRAFYEQALIFQKKGNNKLAASALEQALAIAPGFTDARSMLAQLHFATGNLMGAVAEAGKMLYFTKIPGVNGAQSTSPVVPTFPLESVLNKESDPIPATNTLSDLPPAVAQALGLASSPVPKPEPTTPPSTAATNEAPSPTVVEGMVESQKTPAKRSHSRWSFLRKPHLPRPAEAKVEAGKPAEAIKEREGAEPISASWSRTFKDFFRKTDSQKAEKSGDSSSLPAGKNNAVSSVPPPEEVPSVTAKYGLLKENALKNIDGFVVPLPISNQETPQGASFLESIWKQATTALSSIIPDFSKISIPGLSHVGETPAALSSPTKAEPLAVANMVDIPVPVQAVADQPPHAVEPSPPLPMDVANILKKIGEQGRQQPVPEPGPLAISQSFKPPLPTAMRVEQIQTPLPAGPQERANRSEAQALLPQTLGARGNNVELPSAPANQAAAPALIPQAVRDILNRTEPILPAAVQAVNAFADVFRSQPVPVEIPKDASLPPMPIQPTSAAMENVAPAPTAASMNKYFGDVVVPVVRTPKVEPAEKSAESSVEVSQSDKVNSTPTKVIVEKNTKSGAFSYMKPSVDFGQDRAQTRTIPPAGAKAVETKPPAKPEDAVTQRMRYLLEHGTQNLKPGEAFMYSEETGEGLLFLPDGHSERRKLAQAQDPEQVMRARRPDIMEPKDLQYSLSLLGKLLPAAQNTNEQQQQGQPAIAGPSLEQLMNQSSQGMWAWLKQTFKF